MTVPTDRNRLGEEASPYLEQHADNPVNWQPWDEQALEAAREHDVPIFLSVGYSACHWCHVMEEESFEDEAIAERLNENFVPIKVDREERPDLDSVYQTVCQLVTGRGGWPLSVWLTPDGDPFFVGTYFPPEARRNTPGFGDLLDNIAESWADPEEREEMEGRAAKWTSAARGNLEDVPDERSAPDDDVLTDAASAALRAADRDHGGFGRNGPKFPQEARIHVLLAAHERTGRDAYLEVVTETLDGMANGGMYDQVGGGFHRYATDRDWTVPHFEKMLYDNAELPRVYLAAHAATGRERYATVARETFDFLERELKHPEGGLYSTLDAQSTPPASLVGGEASDGDEGDDAPDDEEGAFYVWTPDTVDAAVDDETTAELAKDRYGVTAGGNFEGATVLTLATDVETLAEAYDLSTDEVRERLADAREALFSARAERPRPRRDEKILAGWNGLAISALAEGGLALDDRYADAAADALGFVREHLYDEDRTRLARRYKDGDVAGEGYLEDYAFLARGALDLYGVTGDVDHLAFARDLASVVVEEFYDENARTLYFTPASGAELVARPQELRDQSTPSSVGVATATLAALDAFSPDDEFGAVAESVVETHGESIRTGPLEHASLVLATDRVARGHTELTVAADGLPDEWRERLGRTYLPGRLLAPRPSTAAGLESWLDRLGLDEGPPVWAERSARDGEPTVYVCRNRVCSPPETDLDAALSWLEENA